MICLHKLVKRGKECGCVLACCFDVQSVGCAGRFVLAEGAEQLVDFV